MIATHLAVLDQPEFQDPERLRELFRAIEARERLIAVVDEVLDPSGVTVRLGDEVPEPVLRHCALVAAPWGETGSLGAGGDRPQSHGLRARDRAGGLSLPGGHGEARRVSAQDRQRGGGDPRRARGLRGGGLGGASRPQPRARGGAARGLRRRRRTRAAQDPPTRGMRVGEGVKLPSEENRELREENQALRAELEAVAGMRRTGCSGSPPTSTTSAGATCGSGRRRTATATRISSRICWRRSITWSAPSSTHAAAAGTSRACCRASSSCSASSTGFSRSTA